MNRLALSTLVLALIALAAFAAVPAAPEKPDLPPERLRELATHVVVGEVRAVTTRTERDGSWEVTHHVAELDPSKVEKGEGIDPEGLVYVRYWTRRWKGLLTPPASTNGHRGVPTKGETVRVYLARNAYDGFTKDNDDGGYNVIGANGFERPKPAPKDR